MHTLLTIVTLIALTGALVSCSLFKNGEEPLPKPAKGYYTIKNDLPEYCDGEGECFGLSAEARTRIFSQLHRKLCVPVQ